MELARAPAPAAAARRMSRPRPDMSERRTRSGGAAKVSGERRALGRRGAESSEGRRPAWKALPLPPEEARLPPPPCGSAPRGPSGDLPSLSPEAVFQTLRSGVPHYPLTLFPPPGLTAASPTKSLRRSQRKSGSDPPSTLPEIRPKVSRGPQCLPRRPLD